MDCDGDREEEDSHSLPSESIECVLECKDAQDEHTLLNLTGFLYFMACVYILSCCVTFFSSTYIGEITNVEVARLSHVDVLVQTFDLLCVDLSSAAFVALGYLTAHVYPLINPEARNFVILSFSYGILTDLLLVMIPSVLFGTLYEISHNRLNLLDVVTTLFDLFRITDYSQNVHHTHSYNLTAWPAQSFLTCFGLWFCVAGCYKELALFRNGLCLYFLSILFVTLVGTASFFVSLNPTSNNFNAIATSPFYRAIEFLCGVHWYMHKRITPSSITVIESNIHSFRAFVYIYFYLHWVSLLDWPLVHEDMCVRLYPRNSCLSKYNFAFVRGCWLGIVVVSHSTQSACFLFPMCLGNDIYANALAMITAVSFAWPVLLSLHFVLNMSCDNVIMGTYAAVFASVSFIIIKAISHVYSWTIRQTLVMQLEMVFDNFVAHPTCAACLKWSVLSSKPRNSQPSPATEQSIVVVEQ